MSDVSKQKTVATASDAQSAMANGAAMVRTLVAGTEAMRKAGTTYLPQEPGESSESYNERKARSFLFNATGKTVDDMTGKVFTKPVVCEKDVPEKIKACAENIDLAGRHLNVFARDVFKDGMQTGIGYILTDMPPAIPNATRADEASAGHRPYLVYIPLERVLGWKSQTIGGVEKLTQFRFMECVTEADGDFHEKEIEQVRVIEPGTWRTFRKDDKGEWKPYESGTISVTDEICVAPVYINRTGFMTGAPPLSKLAELNVAHWQSSSDQRNILHVARVPILGLFGWNADDKIEIGAGRALRNSSSEAKAAYVEHSGAAIDAGQTDIDKLEFQMQTQGLQLLVPQPGGKTATGEVRDDAKENSPLAMMATALQDALEQSFGFMARFTGETVKARTVDGGGSVVVNKDFGIQLGAATLTDLISMRNSRLISEETFWAECQRRGVLSDSFDPKVEKDRLANEAPELDSKSGKPMDLNAGP